MKKKNLGMFSKVTAAAVLASTILSPIGSLSANAETAPGSIDLRILETTDVHANIMDYDYYQTKSTIEYGLTRTADLINTARAEKQNSLLFDNGDLLQGNPLADYIAKVKKLGATETHPVYKAMNLLDYDAATFGNHEFNYGLDFLHNAIEEAKFPYVNANIYADDKDNDNTNDANKYKPYQILKRTFKDSNGNNVELKVGVIGLVTPQIMQWDKANLEGQVKVKDIVATAEKFVPQMKAEGADLVVALAHTGFDATAEAYKDAENAVLPLSKVTDIDAILFGHKHVVFPGTAPDFANVNGVDATNGTINGVAAVEAGNWGNNLGVIDMKIEQVNGKWEVTGSKSASRPVFVTEKQADGSSKKIAKATPVQAIADAVKTEHEETIQFVNTKIGTTNAPMYSYFARVQDDPTIQIVNNAQTWYVENYVAKNLPEYKNVPILSAGAPFKAGRGGPNDYTYIQKGDLTIKSANDLYLYPNTLKAVELTGAQVKEWLEMSAAQFNEVNLESSDSQDIINSAFETFNYDVIDGVKYEIDITVPAKYKPDGSINNANSSRIKNLRLLDGTKVDPAQKFLVATNNYRATGGGNFPGLAGGKAKIVIDSPDENRQILMDYIMTQPSIDPSADGNWSIKPINKEVDLFFKSSPSDEAQGFTADTTNIKYTGSTSDSKGTWGKYSIDLFQAPPANIKVQLLGINDFHGQLDTTKVVSGKVAGGAEYLASYLKQRERTNPNTLMVHSGDAVGASSPTSALLQDEPTMEFLNDLGFDVGTVGNHEFDEGVAEMMRLIDGGRHPKTYDQFGVFKGVDFPYVSGNIVNSETNELIFDPYVVKEVGSAKVGFIGVTLSDTPSIVTPAGTAGVKFLDEVPQINKYAAELKSKGVEAIVVLAHNPGVSNTDGTNASGEIVDFANQVDDEVDVIFGAHNHAYTNALVDNKLLVQAYSSGTAFADVDIEIDPVTGDIVEKRASVVTTFQNGVTPDAAVKAKVDSYKAIVSPIIDRVIGEAAVEMKDDQNEHGESVLGNVIADAMKAEMGSDFAFMNPGGIRADLNAGEITWGELFTIQPFGNDLVKMTLTGQQVKDLLNQQWTPNKVRMLQIAGLKYTWSEQLPMGNRVVDVFLPDGSKIDLNKDYTVTVNNFMAGGGDNYTALLGGKNPEIGPTDLDGLVNYVAAQPKPFTAQIEGRHLKVVDTTTTAPVVNEVTTDSTAITGTAEAGATVVAKVADAEIGRSTADNAGAFSITIEKQAADTEISVVATDLVGNVSTATVVKVVDKAAPNKPFVNQVRDNDKKVTGKSEVDGKVTVKKGSTVLGTGVVDKNGSFSVTLKAAQPAGTVLTVTVADKAGNVSEATSVTVVDKTAPVKPVVNTVKDSDKKVTGKAEAGSKVTVKAGSTVLGYANADKYGSFSVTLKKAQKAGTKLTVFVTDKAGNNSVSVTVSVVDKTPPAAPTVNKVKASSTTVTGKAEAYSTVYVKAGSKVVGYATANKYGNYTVKIKKQKAGTKLTVQAKDKAGNYGKSVSVTVAK
ncbi:bifunctional 2',3'-cyclic-nucleotide 2'-phosphodiesterase/3'-nucleotidase [Bacillus sp. EB01]|uniref:bifunctional 2',3'-cyclic-nucleotide 2'-phosphodiesterase/3'-nucleotidase n=1 Tax=Bacillus sp. EB01 TaxID=1347086 RepID=UPI0009DCAE2E|nr:bifunctional 2',3'-cyclic-nucleotide 2'-phosphodiesterase/3'-nucleotidase [Bacillus sp. EB01]